MRWWSELIVDNPMLIEAKLFGRRFFGAHAIANTLAVAAIALLLALVVGLLYVYELSYTGPSIAALVVLTILVPILLHGSIAGERERRSWDMLLVAPITNAQIIIGKFSATVGAIAIIVIAFGLAIFIGDYPKNDRLATGSMVLLVILTFALLLAAFTLLVSAWSKRSITALSIVYGSLFFTLVALPALITATSTHTEEIVYYLNPYYAVTQINQERFPPDYYIDYDPAVAPEGPVDVNSYLVYGVMHILIYSALAVLCLWLATRSLNVSGLDDPMLKRSK